MTQQDFYDLYEKCGNIHASQNLLTELLDKSLETKNINKSKNIFREYVKFLVKVDKEFEFNEYNDYYEIALINPIKEYIYILKHINTNNPSYKDNVTQQIYHNYYNETVIKLLKEIEEVYRTTAIPKLEDIKQKRILNSLPYDIRKKLSKKLQNMYSDGTIYKLEVENNNFFCMYLDEWIPFNYDAEELIELFKLYNTVFDSALELCWNYSYEDRLRVALYYNEDKYVNSLSGYNYDAFVSSARKSQDYMYYRDSIDKVYQDFSQKNIESNNVTSECIKYIKENIDFLFIKADRDLAVLEWLYKLNNDKSISEISKIIIDNGFHSALENFLMQINYLCEEMSCNDKYSIYELYCECKIIDKKYIYDYIKDEVYRNYAHNEDHDGDEDRRLNNFYDMSTFHFVIQERAKNMDYAQELIEFGNAESDELIKKHIYSNLIKNHKPSKIFDIANQLQLSDYYKRDMLCKLFISGDFINNQFEYIFVCKHVSLSLTNSINLCTH